ncbi:MAG: alanine--tRNA ligase [Spirochaetota bacterium]|jgi:alanyl-tRNA synthetase|nr:alanine--tRNA ligase [Spirochaetota bacterium]
MKTSKEIRTEFLDFFKSKGHTIVPSAPLLPIGDKTLLFTNAGMNQFKDVFLGQGKRAYSRACDTQKCMRVSGKHNDLDEVGHDGYHHTFFEMLGNWSFGDYYKKEAIAWAWELLTEVWKLPKEKLYATVYTDDQEAYQLWAGETDIARDHILYFAEKDNFWEMGEVGPCGPCSELHIDRGPESCNKAHIAGHICGVNAGCSRYIELWNLVFIQYNRQPDGSLVPLPEKHVDTGMGFERVVSLLQGKKSNYESDLFMPILEAIAARAKLQYQGGAAPEDAAMQVIADHLRALAFSIADGIMPANDGRGYVLRRILRRALRFGQKLNFEEPFMTGFLPALDASMGDAFPELRREMTRVRDVIAHEEERYFATLHAGMRELNSIIAIAKNSSQIIAGRDIFRLYDSLGFPAELVLEAARDEGLDADQEGFRALMEEQKNRGRQSWRGRAEGEFGALDEIIAAGSAVSEYSGDTVFADTSSILLLVKDHALAEVLSEGEEGYLAALRTPFYAEGGGQQSDQGTIQSDTAQARVLEVVRHGALSLHRVRVEEGSFKSKDAIALHVDAERKKAIARHHSATHLLQQALIEVLGTHVAQAGSLVAEDRLRFDFSHFSALTTLELERAEARVNAVVRSDMEVSCALLGREEAVQSGAKAIFGEKYGEVVRVVTMGDFSKELCGGTHVARTGEIGLVQIIAESSVSSGVRRIEAVAGAQAIAHLQEQGRILASLSSRLNLPKGEIDARVAALQSELSAAAKELVETRTRLAVIALEEAAKNAAQTDGVRIIITRLDGAEIKVIKESVDDIRNRYKNSVVLVGSAQENEKCMLILAASGDALLRGFDAKRVVGEIAAYVDGSGGGRKDMAQAGGKNAARLHEALAAAYGIIERHLGAAT